MFTEESNGLEHKVQVQEFDSNILPNAEGQGIGASFSDIEVERQKYSSDSHDSEDENLIGHDFTIESLLAPETTHVILDRDDTGLVSDNRDGETRWLEHDEVAAVWVLWSGKWQAGIKCARADWPLSTVKAKPTHDEKNYLVIFIPRSRDYLWACVSLLRPIHEFPEPIAYRKHNVGVKMVKDLALACRFIMKKLAVGIVNVIDRLQTKALVETARNVMVWKEFSIEASSCQGYSDLGRVLLKLQNMMLQCYVKPDWLQHSLHSWTQRCYNADTAESVEILREELTDSIMWDEINKLSDTPVQPDLVSEWKNLKNKVMKLFSSSHPEPISGGEVVRPDNNNPLPTEFQLSRKRPKLEVRRADSHSVQVDNDISNQDSIIEIDAGFFDGRGTVNVSTPAQIQIEDNATKSWGEIVVENKDTIPVNGGEAKNLLDFGSKSRQCEAFIEAKGRQCVRWANDGDIYCCVHLASRFVGGGVKAEASTPVLSPMCNGTTVLGTKCKHRALSGFTFCKKHRPRVDANAILASPDKNLKRNHDDFANKSGTITFNDVLMEDGEAPLEVDPISFRGVGIVPSKDMSIVKYEDTEVKHCLGSCTPEDKESCLESPKKVGLYCEKHLPSWLKRARDGKSRILTKEVFLELLKRCYSLEQKVHLHRACDLFFKLFKSILSMRNPVPKEVQFQWALSEASKDVKVGELLMELVRSEIGRLRLIWGFDVIKETPNPSFIEQYVPGPANISKEHDLENTIRCKLCSGKFVDDEALGGHWMDSHRREAQWLFRGYVCAICLDAFTNKKGLESHVHERHHVQFVDQCMLLQCIPCGGHFGNPDQLWLHVLSVHSANLRFSEDSQQIESQDSLQNLELAILDNENSSSRRFICKFCGLKFDLLPDLGRHHQAVHMGTSSVVPRSSRKGIRFYSYRLKSGRLTRPSFRKGLGVAADRIRNRATASIKKRILATRTVSEEKVESPIVAEVGALGRLAESECSSVAKMLFSRIQKTKPRPSNLEILSVARSTCCKVNLQAMLEEKYGALPERLCLKAAKLCSEHNIIVEWHKEGFTCSRACKEKTYSNLASSVLALTENFKGHRSLDPRDNHELEMDECHYVIHLRDFKQSWVPRTYVLCDDISFGKESVPVICVVDENLLDSLQIVQDCSDDKITSNSMPWENFTYEKKPLLGASVCAEAQGLRLGCACTNSSTCSPAACDHVYLFDNDYEDAKDIYGKPMLGRFPYDDNGRLVLEEGYPIYECNKNCSCSESCPNRILQGGVKAKLEVFKTEKKGWAVRAREAILRGTFVCEFVGELIDEQELSKRNDSYCGQCWGYFYNIDAQNGDMRKLTEEPVPYTIDAMKYGNVSRYINHSCSPNLTSRQVLVESMDCQLARIGFFASQDIAVGEELTYRYSCKLQPGRHPCYCGASNCRGQLY